MKLKVFSQIMDRIVLCLILLAVFFHIPVALGASANDACFTGLCHSSSGPTIDRSLYDSNPHKIIKCIECHESSIDPVNDSNHGHFIRQLNGSKITGPLITSYNSQNFSLCYFCHAEKNVVGILPGWIPSSNHVNLTPIIVSSIGSNFINVDPLGFHIGSQYGSEADIPTNIHWNHLDAFGSIKAGSFGLFDSNKDGITDSYQSCPACHNVHGTNYPKMTRNALAISYSNDSNGTFGYIGSDAYLNPGGDVYCTGCHTSDTTFKYYRNEINLFEDCVSCHVDGAPGNVNRTAFSQGVHVNINNSDGNGLVNNSDCWTCHFNRDMNRSNIRQCADCHAGSGISDAPTAPKIRTHMSGVKITNYSCVDCHSKVIVNPGIGIPNITSHYLKRPTISSINYCDYCHGPNATAPFPATNKTIPAFSHDDPSWDGHATCRTCHSNSSVSADPRANDTSSFHDLTTELGDVYNGTTKANCVLCHVQKDPQFVAAPSPPHDTSGYTVVDCRGCHTTGAGTDPQKLHSVTAFATGGCIACHSNNATRFFVDTSLFGRHANVNATGGTNNVTDDDCKTCHFGAANGTMKMVLGAANSTNTWFCEDCHTSAGSGPIKPTDSNLIKDGLSHGSTNCQWCHIAGEPLPRPLDNTLRYHPNGPRGTAAGKNCLTCHYNPTPTELLFHAPLEKHGIDMNSCGFCHDQASNHGVTRDPWSTNPPKVISLSVTTPVPSGTGSQINATISDGMVRMRAARYQVTNSSGIVLDWTDMNPIIGFEYVNAIINTSGLLGNYNVNVKGMAWAPKVDGSKPYYPLNGPWSGISTVQLNVTQLAYNSTTPSITSVTITPTNPSAGNEINITVAINNPGASFNGRVEGNVWAPDGTGKYLGWENVVIPYGASTVTIIGPAGGAESSYITHQAGTYLYDVFLENVDKGQVYLNPTDSRRGVPFSVGAAADVYISNVALSASPTVGSIMTLKVTIFNPTSSAYTGTMDANIWDSVRGYALTPQSISIEAGGSTTLTFSYSPVNHGLHSYDFFMLSPGQNTKAPWGFPCMDYVAGIGFNVV